ncbi:hypothetical protein ACFPAG_09125 [Vogesella sp. GCM10023246]|uniref:Uncharacterized protein n=1 Tax=Vogesella oryzagri TaxID=3160864 RepID=A0ABV1M3G1_9NEIS
MQSAQLLLYALGLLSLLLIALGVSMFVSRLSSFRHRFSNCLPSVHHGQP